MASQIPGASPACPGESGSGRMRAVPALTRRDGSGTGSPGPREGRMRKGGVPLRVAVAGGSIGGLCAGIALRAIGCDVAVYERTPGAMASRGAGITVQDDLLNLLRRAGAPSLPLTSCRQRRYLVPDGGDGSSTPLPQRFTSWQAIHQTLRSAF